MVKALERPASLQSSVDSRASENKSKSADKPGRSTVESSQSHLDIGVNPGKPLPTAKMTNLEVKELR